MNKNFLFLLILILSCFLTVSAVNAHGADITDDIMILTNESNGELVKNMVDSKGVDIKVYKFTSENDVMHQMEHAKTNPNKRILAVAYQDTVNDFLNNNSDLKNRIIVIGDDNQSISEGIDQLASNKIENQYLNGFEIPLIVGLIIGAVIGFIGGVLIMKRKIKE